MQFLRWLGKSLVRQILLAMLLGILIGRILFVAELPQAAEYFQILGDFFTKALRAVAPILVFILITHAISRHQQGQARGLKTIIVLYVIGTFAAAAVAVLASTWYPTTLHLTGNPEAVTAPESLKEVLTTLLFKITDNPISAATNGNYIGILAWAILAGVALRHANSVTKTVLDDAARVIHYVVSLVIRIAPYGVFGLVTATVATTGFSTFDTYARLIAVLLGSMAVVALIVNPLMVWAILRQNPYPLVWRCLSQSGTAHPRRNLQHQHPARRDHQHGGRGHHHRRPLACRGEHHPRTSTPAERAPALLPRHIRRGRRIGRPRRFADAHPDGLLAARH